MNGQGSDGLQNILSVLTQGAPWAAGALGDTLRHALGSSTWHCLGGLLSCVPGGISVEPFLKSNVCFDDTGRQRKKDCV